MSASGDVAVPVEPAGAVDGLVEEFTGVFARDAIADRVLDGHRRLRPARVGVLLTELDVAQVAR